ncbi:response regulator [Benzoatithermus flavus]|uniref:Response regulator n=1 Tax=Benzoatithermus flavus TaxID=3108223 RepID=A0ABU8XTI7_9PROT
MASKPEEPESPARRRVLIVEDEALIALDMEATLRQQGYEIVGLATSVREAIRLLDEMRPDAAVLDINLGQEKVFVLADALAERDVPFVFVTGYEPEILPPRHRHRPTAVKPCRGRLLVELLTRAAILPR